jgi:hypothetical protein
MALIEIHIGTCCYCIKTVMYYCEDTKRFLTYEKRRVSMNNWIIYGANGYTGTLIACAAVAAGLCPRLAGRNAEAIARHSSQPDKRVA